jgi:hypothetical protein
MMGAMISGRTLKSGAGRQALAIGVLLATLAMPALAQDQKPDHPGFFTRIGRWLDDSYHSMRRGVRGAGDEVDNFGREAGIAAKSTANAAKDAADSLSRLPNVRVVNGHESCPRAANGAPDCVAAANKLCQGHGFASGKSVSMTTAQECPVQVMLGQRAPEAGECRDVTFVSRAICN